MTADLRFTIAWFPTASPSGPAYGEQEIITWADFAGAFEYRRTGTKDGPCFVPARFALEPNGRSVRRKKANVLARTAVALDLENMTGENPPSPRIAAERLRTRGWAGLVYTSHSHRPNSPRYRLVLALSGEIDANLPVVDVIAGKLALSSVLDRSKSGPASLFFLPSCNYGHEARHEIHVISGDPMDAGWLAAEADAIVAAEEAERDRTAADAQKEAADMRLERLAAGFDPDDSLIEKIRSRLDLVTVLRDHRYAVSPSGKYRHPQSKSGVFGASIATFGGVPRIYSFNASDPLHPANLPSWCTVKAVDAVDATIILAFSGNRARALKELAERFGLTNRAGRSAVAKLLFRLIRQQAGQAEIEERALAEGRDHGLTREDICHVAAWVVARATA